MHDGYCYKYDMSMKQSEFYDLVEVMRSRLGSSVTRVVGYGHVGDGTLYNWVLFHYVNQYTYKSISKTRSLTYINFCIFVNNSCQLICMPNSRKSVLHVL